MYFFWLLSLLPPRSTRTDTLCPYAALFRVPPARGARSGDARGVSGRNDDRAAVVRVSRRDQPLFHPAPRPPALRAAQRQRRSLHPHGRGGDRHYDGTAVAGDRRRRVAARRGL